MARFAGRIINIHPSPFCRRSKDWTRINEPWIGGAVHHGATVHIVTPELDDGPICLQAGLNGTQDVTAEALASQVLELEHALYPFILYALCCGILTISNGQPEWHGSSEVLRSAPAPIRTVLDETIIWPASEQNRN